MTDRAKAIASYLGRLLELRLRAFVYALFALNGFILGVMVMHGMAEQSIAELGQATRAAILEAYGR